MSLKHVMALILGGLGARTSPSALRGRIHLDGVEVSWADLGRVAAETRLAARPEVAAEIACVLLARLGTDASLVIEVGADTPGIATLREKVRHRHGCRVRLLIWPDRVGATDVSSCPLFDDASVGIRPGAFDATGPRSETLRGHLGAAANHAGRD